jgi:HD domain
VLSLANPTLFGRAKRMRVLADLIAAHTGAEDRWLLEVVANLSQIGRITLPDSTAAKLARGDTLTEIEEAMVEHIPEMARTILGKIPRLDAILEIIDYIDKNYDGTGRPRTKVSGDAIPFEARVLRLAGRVEELQGRGYSVRRILDAIRLEAGNYDPRLVKAYEAVADVADDTTGTRGLDLYELRVGMLIVEPVKSRAGVMLVAGGQEVTQSLLGRIQNYHDTVGIELPIWVRPNALSAEETKDENAGTALSRA